MVARLSNRAEQKGHRSMSLKPKVAIISINWNGERRLGKFLADLRKIVYPRERLELIIHDNASSDKSRDLIRAGFGSLKEDCWGRLVLLEAPFHPGPNKAYVNAYEATSSDAEFVLAIDNDVNLEPGALVTMLNTLEVNPAAAVIGCYVLFAAQPHLPNCGAIKYSRWSMHSTVSYPPSVSECDEILDCVYLLRKQAISSVKYFHDERYYFFCMGKELFARLRGAGWLILYNPQAIAYHDAGHTSGRHSNFTAYLSVRDNVVYNILHSTLLRR